MNRDLYLLTQLENMFQDLNNLQPLPIEYDQFDIKHLEKWCKYTNEGYH